MITLTESAKQHIKNILQKKGENAAFRIAIKKTGCSGYMYIPEIVNIKKESDVEISESDLLIYIDQAAIPLMKDTVIDYVKKGLGVSQLIFNNPGAESLCGCGESFQVKVISDQ